MTTIKKWEERDVFWPRNRPATPKPGMVFRNQRIPTRDTSFFYYVGMGGGDYLLAPALPSATLEFDKAGSPNGRHRRFRSVEYLHTSGNAQVSIQIPSSPRLTCFNLTKPEPYISVELDDSGKVIALNSFASLEEATNHNPGNLVLPVRELANNPLLPVTDKDSKELENTVSDNSNPQPENPSKNEPAQDADPIRFSPRPTKDEQKNSTEENSSKNGDEPAPAKETPQSTMEKPENQPTNTAPNTNNFFPPKIQDPAPIQETDAISPQGDQTPKPLFQQPTLTPKKKPTVSNGIHIIDVGQSPFSTVICARDGKALPLFDIKGNRPIQPLTGYWFFDQDNNLVASKDSKPAPFSIQQEDIPIQAVFDILSNQPSIPIPDNFYQVNMYPILRKTPWTDHNVIEIHNHFTHCLTGYLTKEITDEQEVILTHVRLPEPTPATPVPTQLLTFSEYKAIYLSQPLTPYKGQLVQSTIADTDKKNSTYTVLVGRIEDIHPNQQATVAIAGNLTVNTITQESTLTYWPKNPLQVRHIPVYNLRPFNTTPTIILNHTDIPGLPNNNLPAEVETLLQETPNDNINPLVTSTPTPPPETTFDKIATNPIDVLQPHTNQPPLLIIDQTPEQPYPPTTPKPIKPQTVLNKPLDLEEHTCCGYLKTQFGQVQDNPISINLTVPLGYTVETTQLPTGGYTVTVKPPTK